MRVAWARLCTPSLAEEVRDVASGGLLADHQALADGAVGQALGDQRRAPRPRARVSPSTRRRPGARPARPPRRRRSRRRPGGAASRRRCPSPKSSHTGWCGDAADVHRLADRREAERHEDRRERVGVGHHRVEPREARAQLHVDALHVQPARADRGRQHLAAVAAEPAAHASTRSPGARRASRAGGRPTRAPPGRARAARVDPEISATLQEGADRAVRARGRRRRSPGCRAHQRPSSARRGRRLVAPPRSRGWPRRRPRRAGSTACSLAPPGSRRCAGPGSRSGRSGRR